MRKNNYLFFQESSFSVRQTLLNGGKFKEKLATTEDKLMILKDFTCVENFK
jgi:hypothetical protein